METACPSAHAFGKHAQRATAKPSARTEASRTTHETMGNSTNSGSSSCLLALARVFRVLFLARSRGDSAFCRAEFVGHQTFARCTYYIFVTVMPSSCVVLPGPWLEAHQDRRTHATNTTPAWHHRSSCRPIDLNISCVVMCTLCAAAVRTTHSVCHATRRIREYPSPPVSLLSALVLKY